MTAVVGFRIWTDVRTDSDETVPSTNPADGTVNHEVAAATPAHVDEAVRVAARAAGDRAWRTMAPHARARVLYCTDAGSVWINTYKQLSISTPFGGFKDSGIGRERGIRGLPLYQQPTSVYLGLHEGHR